MGPGAYCNWRLSRSVVLDGADDEEDETDDRCGAEGEDCAGGVAGAGDCSRPGAALSGASEPGLCLEEEAAGARCAGIRPEGRPGRPRRRPSATSNGCTPRSGS